MNKTQIKKEISRLQSLFLLDVYTIEIKHNKSICSVPDTSACVNIVTAYKKVVITIHPLFSESTEQEQLETLKHEMLHIVTDPMFELSYQLRSGTLVTQKHITDTWEAVTEHLVKIT